MAASPKPPARGGRRRGAPTFRAAGGSLAARPGRQGAQPRRQGLRKWSAVSYFGHTADFAPVRLFCFWWRFTSSRMGNNSAGGQPRQLRIETSNSLEVVSDAGCCRGGGSGAPSSPVSSSLSAKATASAAASARCGSAQTEVRRLHEVEALASLDAPVHEVATAHVAREEVREVDEVVAVPVELGRFLVVQVPIGAKPVCFR